MSVFFSPDTRVKTAPWPYNNRRVCRRKEWWVPFRRERFGMCWCSRLTIPCNDAVQSEPKCLNTAWLSPKPEFLVPAVRCEVVCVRRRTEWRKDAKSRGKSIKISLLWISCVTKGIPRGKLLPCHSMILNAIDSSIDIDLIIKKRQHDCVINLTLCSIPSLARRSLDIICFQFFMTFHRYIAIFHLFTSDLQCSRWLVKANNIKVNYEEASKCFHLFELWSFHHHVKGDRNAWNIRCKHFKELSRSHHRNHIPE